MKYQFQPQHDP